MGTLIHRLYFEKSASLSRGIHTGLDIVKGLGKMATWECSLVAGQNGPGILVSLGPCLC